MIAIAIAITIIARRMIEIMTMTTKLMITHIMMRRASDDDTHSRRPDQADQNLPGRPGHPDDATSSLGTCGGKRASKHY